jgi:hypothetical protein
LRKPVFDARARLSSRFPHAGGILNAAWSAAATAGASLADWQRFIDRLSRFVS